MRVTPAWVVATLAVTAAGLHMAMRVPTAIEMQRGLLRMCAQVGMQPGDWLCGVTATSTLATFVPSSLLVGLGLALPCAVLVASGRRVMAFLPLLVPAADVAGVAILNLISDASARADQSMLGIWGSSPFWMGDPRDTFWSSRPVLGAIIDVTLIGAPVVAGALFAWQTDRARGVSRRRPPVGAAACWLSIAVVAAAIAVLTMGWKRLGSANSMGTYLPSDDEWVAMLVIATFGVLLGADRRFSPWIFAPVALLLSAAIPIALTGSVVRMSAFYAFGAVAPLMTVGLAGSAWRPLAEALGRARARRSSADGGSEIVPIAVPTSPAERSRVRRVVVANALAAGVVAVSLLAARFDPLPVDMASALPTYLGARHLVSDVFVRTQLGEGIAAMDAYHADHSTFRGFGEDDAAGVRWAEYALGVAGPPAPQDVGIEVVSTGANSAQLMGLSMSGRVICARVVHGAGATGVSTWGASESRGSIETRIAQAGEVCGARPLDASAFRTIAIEDLCIDVHDQALILCRGIQRVLRGLRDGDGP